MKAITFGRIDEEDNADDPLVTGKEGTDGQIAIHVNGQDLQVAEKKPPRKFKKDNLQLPTFMGKEPKSFIKEEGRSKGRSDCHIGRSVCLNPCPVSPYSELLPLKLSLHSTEAKC